MKMLIYIKIDITLRKSKKNSNKYHIFLNGGRERESLTFASFLPFPPLPPTEFNSLESVDPNLMFCEIGIVLP
jgi:hypothetical protein